ncbi:hypothetical protein FRC03_012141 [Tulasnella sp. 419]|nr:hypothetical protein FRC03_012141 [Tulasnella sp. 419]
MVKKRKSMRRPNRLVEEEEEPVQETTEANDDEAEGEIVDLTDGHNDEREWKSFAIHVDGELPNVEAFEGSEDGADEETEDQAALEARKKAQEEWDTFREEYHEVVEQLPLSLYRHSSLMHELDTKVQEHLTEMLPLIRSYISLRQSLAPKVPKPVDETPTNDNVPIIHIEESKPSADQEEPKENTDAPILETQRLSAAPEPATSEIAPLNSSAPSENFGTPRLNRVQPDTPLPSPGLFSTAPPTPTSGYSRLSGPHGLGFTRSHSAFLLKAALKAKGKDPRTSREMLIKLNWLTGQMIRASEEKFGLASATYDSVDRHVRALDASIKEYETSLVFGLRPGTRPLQSVMTASDAAILAAGDEADAQLTGLGIAGGAGNQARPKKRKRDRDRERKREKERERRAERRRMAEEARIAQEMADRGDEDDEDDEDGVGKSDALLPVHPNEPRYCYCNQVSFGDMIGCDNPDCEREWFHYSCVGVREAPKPDRKWYCKDCTGLFGRSKKKKKAS